MPKCKAVKTNYIPCEKERHAEQQLCGVHLRFVAEEAAKEAARTADNTSALAKASDRTGKAYALMTISRTPGTEKEYTDAKHEEDLLKMRVKSDGEKREKDLMTQKCKEAAAIKLYEGLAALPLVTKCRVYHPAANDTQCTRIPSSRDGLCDIHRAAFVQHASYIGLSLLTPITLNGLPLHLGNDNISLEFAFQDAVRAARFTRYGTATAPAAVVPAGGAGGGGLNVPPPRRIIAPPILTAPIDIATHIAKQHLEMSEALGKPITCPICYDPVTAENIVMTHCGHVYCNPCLTSVRERERKCPQCRVTI